MRLLAARSGLFACGVSVLLGSCASYLPLPLADGPDLRADGAQLTIAADQLPLPELGPHRLDLRRPLDADDVAIIAVANNPDLKAGRARVGVAKAQAFAAGILPNPQIAFDYGFLIGGPGTTDALTAGIAQDIVPLLTLSSRKAAAAATAASVALEVVWQEWQVVSRARLLYVDAVSLQKQRGLIEQTVGLLRQRYDETSGAMRRGDATLPTVSSDLVALNAAQTQLYDVEQAILKNRHDLNALLGLLPEAKLRLSQTVRLHPIDAHRLGAALRDLAARRPDLLALRLGYEAQEEKVRQAIIEQFPKLNIGTTYGRDTTAVETQAIAVTFSLPIFDRNQGNIAIQHATREQLREEYQARLDAAYGEAARLLSELRLTEQQYGASVTSVGQLREAVATAEPAFRAGNLDERTFVDLRSSLLAKEIATARLEQSILQQRVALQTLVGSRLPDLPAWLAGFP